MIEKDIIDYLESKTGVPAYVAVPEDPPKVMLIIDKTGSGGKSYLRDATLAIQSYAGTDMEAAELNQKVKKWMDIAGENITCIYRSDLNSDYIYPDAEQKKHRYQAVYDLKYYEED